MNHLPPLHVHDYTRYSSSSEAHSGNHPTEKVLSEDDLKFLQQLQKELQGKDCVFLASTPREGEEEKPQVLKVLDANTIQIQGYVGSLVFQGRTVAINSRFDGDGCLFLRYLQENIWDVSSLVKPVPEGPADLEQDGVYPLWLVCQLAVQLQAAWKKGVFRTYRTFSHFDSRIRGQIDILRHIRLTMGLDSGRAAYQTREYSPDNPYNRLILCAVDAAQRRYPQMMRRLFQQLPEYKAVVQLLRQLVPGSEQDQPRILLERTQHKITHPVYRSYEAVRLTARAVLRQMGRGLHGRERTVGILLNMDQMWEKFLARTLFQTSPEMYPQQSNDILNGHMTIRPDFYFPSLQVVLDAKNRPAWGDTLGENKWNEYVRDDVYQILSYMLALGCHDGGVIFPIRRSHLKDPKTDFLLPSSFQVPHKASSWKFWSIPFVIWDNSENYEEFQDAIRKQADKIRAYIPDNV